MKTKEELIEQLKIENELLKTAREKGYSKMILTCQESISVLKWVLEN